MLTRLKPELRNLLDLYAKKREPGRSGGARGVGSLVAFARAHEGTFSK